VRDQEEKSYKKQVHMQNLAMNRQDMRTKHQKRIIAREMLENELEMPHSRSSSVLSQLTDGTDVNGEGLHKSVTETMRQTQSEAGGEGVGMKLAAHEKWQVNRKNKLDKRAIKMIEARMQQEANELQMMEGWRAAARNSIRDKFVETRHRNDIVERHLDFLHTREKLANSPNTTGKFSSTQFVSNDGNDVDAERNDQASGIPELQSEGAAGDEEEQRATSSLSLPAPRELQQSPASFGSTRRSKSTLPQLRSSTSSPLFPDITMTAGEIEEQQYVLDSLDEIDDFNSSIRDRQVKPNQRLRSLAVDATKSWTRPTPIV